MTEIGRILEDTAVELLRIAVTELPTEYVEVIDEAMEETEGAVGKAQLTNILENVDIAREGSKPMCQDTGIVAFMVKVGDGFPLRSEVKEILVKATRRATEEVPLRPNAVDMFKGNTRDNVGLNGHVPIIYFDLVEGDDLELIAMPKGGGSTNIAAHRMLKPGLGMKGVKQFVIEALSNAGSLGCPPYFVGVGIGGGEDICMKLAKEALLKPFRIRSEDPKVAAIESELLEKVNELGIGAMGLGEGPTALDLHVEMAARHPASLPVGVVISCWALRHAKAVISSDGEVEIDKSV
ncbi:fumarate hydratase [Candidatus Bathyarchaeota archaeon]|nr:fumarate hydratase [Candidatus Bathyarchaeota archaeon]MBL7168058.1 fumarate hydratase [Candidatus Bathyarchaeota archaeon]